MEANSLGVKIESKPIKITKMHILVHPGYIGNMVNQNPQDLLKAEILFEKYKAVVQNLPTNEILIVLVHHVEEKFNQDSKEDVMYAKNIQSIIATSPKPDQIIILTADTPSPSGADKDHDVEVLNKIKSIAKQRGYEIDPETEVEIFGETHNECVHEAFFGIKNTDFFPDENVHIVKELTDEA